MTQKRKKQMMVEFRAKEAESNSKLLRFWRRAATQAAVNPPPPNQAIQIPAATPVQAQPIPIPSTSSSGKYLLEQDSRYCPLRNSHFSLP